MASSKKSDFDYSSLSTEFSKLSKPAQRALINNGIKSPKDLARKSQKEILSFHGMGPASIPVLKSILKKKGLAFKI